MSILVVRARLKPGLPKAESLAAGQCAVIVRRRKVPPLRFASVGMTELFRYARTMPEASPAILAQRTRYDGPPPLTGGESEGIPEFKSQEDLDA
jgi:hypothetical protein